MSKKIIMTTHIYDGQVCNGKLFHGVLPIVKQNNKHISKYFIKEKEDAIIYAIPSLNRYIDKKETWIQELCDYCNIDDSVDDFIILIHDKDIYPVKQPFTTIECSEHKKIASFQHKQGDPGYEFLSNGNIKVLEDEIEKHKICNK